MQLPRGGAGDDESDPRASCSVTRIREGDRCDVAFVVGEIDGGNAYDLAASLGELPTWSTRSLIIDLRGVEFCSVAGARVLCELDARARTGGVPLALVPSPVVLLALHLLEVLDDFTIYPELDEAFAALPGARS
ncbi:STAS domain-containing protein [Prauserella cavernicola]|uniref:STAS domain-containing protein n=1 Tax=Prauserella cavernicola TaxID=2800127 RepID=A0A934QYD6_9PSEU|nr:STAS domain-containing protein [Prauserella cavernicola]MBK1787559.1 STAS domain-containing protein [Prauserella cavernicola]